MSFRNPQRSLTAKISPLSPAQSEMPPPAQKENCIVWRLEKKTQRKEKSRAKHSKEDLHLYLTTCEQGSSRGLQREMGELKTEGRKEGNKKEGRKGKH